MKPQYYPFVELFFVVILSLLGASCASTGAFQNDASKYGFTTQIVQGGEFRHAIMLKNGTGNILHVYLEGDGTPWIRERWIAADPTPSTLLMPALMAQDPAPALFIGRPCYFQTEDSNCTPDWWTSARYAEEITTSLNSVLNTVAGSYQAIWLIGHSGGGTLAMLMAAQRHDVERLITLAGNLDIDAWTHAHNYSPLTGSMNPAKLPALPRSIQQRHYLGSKDDRINGDMIKGTIAQQPYAQLIILDDIDHSCCWKQIWPALLHQNKNPGDRDQ